MLVINYLTHNERESGVEVFHLVSCRDPISSRVHGPIGIESLTNAISQTIPLITPLPPPRLGTALLSACDKDECPSEETKDRAC